MKKLLLCAVLTALLFCGAALAHAASAGIVLTVSPGAWAVRDGKKIALDVKSEVLKGDELVTDGTGRVQVIFADDTTISLGADTTVAVADFVFDAPDKKASFSADMAKGMARFVTGKVVEKNRSGFSVTTPQATVGIRGTTFVVNVSPKGVTSVIGLDVKGAFPIAVTNKATGAVSEIKVSGMAVDAAPAGNTSYQTPPGQFSQSSSSVNSNTAVASASASEGSSATETAPAAGSASASPETTIATSATTATTSTAATATAAVETVTTSAATTGTSLYTPEASGDAQTLTNSAGQGSDETLADLGGGSGGMLTPPIITPPPGPVLSATWSGSIHNGFSSTSPDVGNVSFNTTLTAGFGTMTNAQVQITGGGYAVGTTAQQDATSIIVGGVFNTSLAVTTTGAPGSINVGNSGSLTGAIGGLGTGSSASGLWTIKDNSNNDMFGSPVYFEADKTP
ncbi:MAG: hypothetical protein DELT_01837 [Desulfovibrio sp.]